MYKRLRPLLIPLLITTATFAQDAEKVPSVPDRSPPAAQPFLFSITTLTRESRPWNMDYSASYGERVSEPFGYSGIGQQFALTGYLGDRFTLYAKVALGFPTDGAVSRAQQVEVVRDVAGGKKALGFRMGIGLGGSLDYDNLGALFSRITLAYDSGLWRLSGNLVLEKAFGTGRDAIDVITGIGVQHRIWGPLYAGMEALGEDLEGFWEKDEREGGAKLLVGPSLNLAPGASRFSFSLCGGPVVYATRSQVVPSDAIRQLPFKNGFAVQARVVYNLSGTSKS